MVKIKEGIVMTASQKAEFDRVNALPRKQSGRVAYYFRPQTKYPPRIYVYMDADLWRSRNRRPMGLQNAVPFLSRPMNKEEIEYHHFNTRLCCYQYEDWDQLIYAEEQEADELDKEDPGTGTAFLNTLKSFRERYKIGKPSIHPQEKQTAPPVSEESRYFSELMSVCRDLTTAEIIGLMETE